MKMVRGMLYVLVSVFGFMLSGCEKEPCGCVEGQPVLFEYRYVNHAWGYQEHGWLIDSNGQVRRFQMPGDYKVPDSTGTLSREDLLHNLSQTDSVTHTIDQADLDFYASLIQGAADGETGDSRNIAADAGSSVLSCYQYDPETDTYRYVFLAQSGDWEQFNTSHEAETLVEWLREFGVFWLSD